MKLFNSLLLATTMCGYVLGGGEDISTTAMVTLLSRRLDRNTLDLVSLERRVQSQFDELKIMIGNIGSAKQDESVKVNIKSDIKPLIESSIRAQASTVYRALTAEKKVLRQMKTDIETRVKLLESKSENDTETLQNHLHQSLVNVDSRLNATVQPLQTDLNETSFEIARVNDVCKSNITYVNDKLTEFNSIQTEWNADVNKQMIHVNANQNSANVKQNSLESTQEQQQRSINTASLSISSLKYKVSNLEMELSNLKRESSSLKGQISTNSGKIGTNANSVSSIWSKIGTHVSFSTKLTTRLPNIRKNTKIVFNKVYQNDGGHYDSSTGVFTAPVTGVYIFLFDVATYIDKQAHVKLVVDDRSKTEAIAHSDDNPNQTGGGSAILNVYKGDRVWIQTVDFDDTYAIRPWRTAFHGGLLYT